jgi:XTP/dITP diphosphohydrolase
VTGTVSQRLGTTLLLATTSRDKVREIEWLLPAGLVRLVSLADLPAVDEPNETGTTFAENARLKALYYDALLCDTVLSRLVRAQALGGPGDLDTASGPTPMRVLTLAEDSGLEIDALNGEPGVRSARFVRPDASYPERFDEIYRRVGLTPDAPRTARFHCAVAVVEGGHVRHQASGTIEGLLADAPRGAHGFGYDPIFWYPPLSATLAEVSPPEKLAVAHRGHAFRAVAAWLSRSH